MGTPIDGAGSRGFGTTGRSGAGDNLVTDKGRGRAEMVLSSAEEVERDTDQKVSFARRAWSILHATVYHASGSVLAGLPYGMVAIWLWMPNRRPRQNFTTSVQGSM